MYLWWRGTALGVQMFFVISGIVIFRAHRKDFNEPEKASVFYWKRFRRVYPLYWICLSLTLLNHHAATDPSASHQRLRGSLHSATDDETVRCSGRDDASCWMDEGRRLQRLEQLQQQIPPTSTSFRVRNAKKDQRPAVAATGSGSGWRERAFTSQARPKKRRMEIPYQLGSNSYQARP